MDEEEREMINIAVSLGFSIIGMIIQFLRDAGVSEEVIVANWDSTKQKHAIRPSEALPHVPETPTEGE